MALQKMAPFGAHLDFMGTNYLSWKCHLLVLKKSINDQYDIKKSQERMRVEKTDGL